MSTCSRCGCVLPPEHTVFDADGRPQCATCLSAAQIEADASAVTGFVRGLGYAGLVIALVSFLVNPWLLSSLTAVACAAYVYYAIAHAPSSCRREGDGGARLVSIAYASMALAVLSIFVRVVVVGR